jgi:hypothetical protein
LNPSVALLTADALSEAYGKFPEAVNNESNRDIIKNNMISTGVSYLLGKIYSSISPIMIAHGCAAALMMIDSYDPSCPVPSGNLDDRDAMLMLRNLDIVDGCQRSLVKFFVNHSSCNCLDELYAQVKSTMPKMGLCSNCKESKESKV